MVPPLRCHVLDRPGGTVHVSRRPTAPGTAVSVPLVDLRSLREGRGDLASLQAMRGPGRRCAGAHPVRVAGAGRRAVRLSNQLRPATHRRASPRHRPARPQPFVPPPDDARGDHRGDGFRSNWGFGWSSNYASPDVTPTADFPYLLFDWGVTQDSTGTINKGYHAFSCSKCHNPHASRLPKLMITNCLDTKQNTWDNSYQVHGTSDSVNSGRSLSNWSSSQNCHRLGGNDTGDNRDTPANTTLDGNKGWNLVTPWTDADGDYGTTGDKAQDNSGAW